MKRRDKKRAAYIIVYQLPDGSLRYGPVYSKKFSDYVLLTARPPHEFNGRPVYRLRIYWKPRHERNTHS